MSIYYSNPATVSIPDDDPVGAQDTVTVDATGSLSSVVVTFRYTHTYPGDLQVSLFHPNGGIHVIWSGSGTSPVTEQLVEITIADPFAEFGTSDYNGTWTFKIRDGAADDTGTLDGWDIEFFGLDGQPSTIDATLDFAAAFSGSTYGQFGEINAALSFAAKATGFQDWLSRIDPVQVQELYLLTITGDADGLDDLVVKISNWQATNQAGARSSYVQAVIPAASDVLEGIEARQNGDLVISKGYKFSDGTTKASEILRSNFDNFRYDRGARRFTVTVSGFLRGKVEQSATRKLTGIRSINVTNGKRRTRCDIDMFLQPGMTVEALDETFKADYINYYVAENDKFCEVSER